MKEQEQEGSNAEELVPQEPDGRELPSPDLLEDAREDAYDFLEGLLDAMGIEADVDVRIVENALDAAINGADVGLLIGRRGQTLEAIQELLRTVVQRQANARIFATLDVEGYRSRRREAVAAHAREMATRALSEGEVELEPMPAFERKVVHDTVAEIQGVSSFSEGEEPRRRVVIHAEK